MQMHKLCRGALLLSGLSLGLISGSAQEAESSRYPLRLHLLAIDDTHPTVRLQPNWCSTSIPDVGADESSAGGSGGQTNPCGSGSASFGGGDDFSGGGRGDLVTPPAGTQALSSTQALSFTYEGCSRVRVPPGFQALPARWKKPGKLEVLVPSDAISGDNRATPTQKCTVTVTLYEYVYLRLRNGAMLKVSQEAYMRKPSLRVFLSGGSETLQFRVPTISVKQEMKAPQ
jgi:hypothetical protein